MSTIILSNVTEDITGEEREKIFREQQKEQSFRLVERNIQLEAADVTGFPWLVKLSDIKPQDIKLTPELIKGVLRRGHKMIVTAPSKAGKTFLMIELALAVASGGEWLGFPCEQGNVLYLNYELDANSCNARFDKCMKKLRFPQKYKENILIANLRGIYKPFDEFVETITALVKRYKIDLVIIDPIYKVFTGSENNQEVVTEFCINVDTIAESGASVVYTHHHSKGIQGDKAAMDRGSGSGVFSRDADAILDLTEILIENGKIPVDPADNTVTAWQLEGVLREFAPFEKKNMYFRFPLHEVSNDEKLKIAKPRSRRGQAAGERMHKQGEETRKEILNTFLELSNNGEKSVSIDEIVRIVGKGDRTVKNYLHKAGFVVSGKEVRKLRN